MFKINGTPILIERFPDKTPRLKVVPNSGELTLEWLYEKDEEMILYFITRHLREKYPVNKLTLYMPYIPHARMDRVKNRQEVFTLKYFCEFINALCFDKVIVRDAHSDVALALLNNVESEPVDSNIKNLSARLLNPQNDIIFYPDEGSCKRYSDAVNFPYAFAVKNRDWKTGNITDLDVLGDLPASPFNVCFL